MKIALSLVLVLLCTAGQASVLPNEAAKPLLREANVLVVQGKYQEAISKFQEAAKADPAASSPLSGIATVLFSASLTAAADNAVKLRQQAESVARQALTLGADDPQAQEVLRNLNDDKPQPLHKPTAAAWKAVEEGEALFQANKPAEALVKYTEAARLDPQYSTAEIFAGDCYFVQKQWPEAEAHFRKATEIEPLSGQAWRFLADALAWQGKGAASEAALLNGIAAQPNQLPTWDKLASQRKKAGYPLTPLKLQRKSSVVLDPDSGKFTVKLDAEFSGKDSKQVADGALWLSLALAEINSRTNKQQDQAADRPFAIALAAWHTALIVVDEAVANGAQDLQDPSLKTMQALDKAGQLETALLLLQYKESWRAEFEAWKKEHPNGIRKFVDTYALRP